MKIKEQPRVKPFVSPETALNYVQKHFPIDKGECDVKYCSVGYDNFRINFYKEKSTSKFVKDYTICRTYYVQMTKDGDTWKHEILDQWINLS